MPSLTLVIGNKNYSSWSLRPWLLLRHAGIDFHEVRIALFEPGYKRRSSSKKNSSRKMNRIVRGLDFDGALSKCDVGTLLLTRTTRTRCCRSPPLRVGKKVAHPTMPSSGSFSSPGGVGWATCCPRGQLLV
jgi:hypothetical protein